VNLRVREDDRERLVLLDTCSVAVEQLTSYFTLLLPDINGSLIHRKRCDLWSEMYWGKSYYFETVALELL